jgi:hypothetical protein
MCVCGVCGVCVCVCVWCVCVVCVCVCGVFNIGLSKINNQNNYDFSVVEIQTILRLSLLVFMPSFSKKDFQNKIRQPYSYKTPLLLPQCTSHRNLMLITFCFTYISSHSLSFPPSHFCSPFLTLQLWTLALLQPVITSIQCARRHTCSCRFFVFLIPTTHAICSVLFFVPSYSLRY